MNQHADVWYIRLPDGKVLRAGSTAAVRHHLESGQLSPDCRVRRSPLEAWTMLDKVAEFADLALSRPSRRRRQAELRSSGGQAALQLQTVGLQRLTTELLSALESTLGRSKVSVASVTGLGVGLALMAGSIVVHVAEMPWPWLPWLVVALVLFGMAGVSTTLLGRLTFLEQSHLRPARWSEAVHRLPGQATRVTLAYLVVIGGDLLAVGGLRWLPGWLVVQHEPAWLAESSAVLAAVATVLGLVLEVGLWPLLGLALPLGPILIVEDCGVGRALRQWGRLLRQHLPRLFLYEALAAAIAVLLSLPFLVPVELAALPAPAPAQVGAVAQATLWLLRGAALGPAIGYLTVANVFIYLHLRYDHTPVR